MQNESAVRVVITGVGVVSPLGLEARAMLDDLRAGKSGINPLQSVPQGIVGFSYGGEATDFTGDIENFGPLDKKMQRTIRKGTKMMCREIEMGVAVAQRALHDADLTPSAGDLNRIGVIYGSDYIMSPPSELIKGVEQCLDENGKFDFSKWGTLGLAEVNPLWLLKYLPNMPASHVAIYNGLLGPNNSLTMREACPGNAIMEAFFTITRGHADALIVGSTGTRIHHVRTLHAALQEKLAADRDDGTTMSRPFDQSRDGAVLSEGAGAIVCETLEHAQNRGATILGEVVGTASSAVGAPLGEDYLRRALANVLRGALGKADPASVGHIHAHGLSTIISDQQEAEAIAEVFGPAEQQPPVTTAKGHIGNLGAGSGMVEIIASVLAMGDNLFPIRNCDSLDPACPINACTDSSTPAGDSFVSANITPQGQASAVRVQRFVA